MIVVDLFCMSSMSDSNIAVKKLKMSNEEPSEGNCAHWVYRKKRFCKMTVGPGKKYCGEHEPVITDENNTNNRIPCPLDNKHTVYKKNLNKHLKICNARETTDKPAYIQKGINAGENIEAGEEDYKNIKLVELEEKELFAIIDKIKHIYKTYVEGTIKTLEYTHKLLDRELAKEEYGKETRKHLIQSAALLGILEHKQKLLPKTSYIEFGAGKGQLAYFLSQIIENTYPLSQVVLIDRMSLRHKKDNKVTDKSLVHRIRVDIADFELNKLEILQKTERNVAVSKHLCGAATDLTIRCITQNQDTYKVTEFIMIALCCHHRCEWNSFVGKKFLVENNIDARQFMIITKMVGWAICGTGLSRERRRMMEEIKDPENIKNNTGSQQLTLQEREEIGFMCKRILDYARVLYLKENGFEATLNYYVPRDVTLENVCLLSEKIKCS